MTARRTLTARAILRAEYGDSRNFMTPHRIRVGKIGRDAAFELAYGSGIEPGTTIYGVSVARVTPDGTERDYDVAGCFHTLADAEAHIANLRADA